jgi:hypothetical protein
MAAPDSCAEAWALARRLAPVAWAKMVDLMASDNKEIADLAAERVIRRLITQLEATDG